MDAYQINFNFQESQALLEFHGELTKAEILRCTNQFIEGAIDNPVLTILLDFRNASVNAGLMSAYDIVEIFDFNVFSKETEIILTPSTEKRERDVDFFIFLESVFVNAGYNFTNRELVG